MKNSCLSAGVCLLAILACLLVTAGIAQADIMLVNRSLPTFGVLTGSDSGTNWAVQNNFAVGYFDPKDPLSIAYPPVVVPGDDFTLPTGPTGPNAYQITDIRMWIKANVATDTYSQEFNNISLLVGPLNGTLTNLNLTPTVSAVTFPAGSGPNGTTSPQVLWQLDFAVSLTGTSGQQFSFAALPDAKACSSATGHGEAYYMEWLESTAQRAQTGLHAGGDGYVSEFLTSGGFVDQWQFPLQQGWGSVPNGDYSVQVFGTHAAASYTWNQLVSGGTYSWNSAANWTSASGDFPNSIDAVVTFPFFTPVSNNSNTTVNLNQAVTLGTLSVTNGSTGGNSHGSSYILTGNGGSLNFQVSSGRAEFDSTTNDVYGTPWYPVNAPINFLSDTVVNAKTIDSSGFSLYGGWNGYAAGIGFTQALGGSGALIKTGPNALWITSTANTFSGDISVVQGYLMAALPNSLGTSTNAISLGSAGEIGHLADNGSVFSLTRPITLTGEGGAIHGNGNTFNVNTTVGGSGTFFVGRSSGQVWFNNAADNTYVGSARVQGYYTDISVNNRIFTGNVTVEDGGYLRLNNVNNVGGTVALYSAPAANEPFQGFLMSRVGVKGDFLPTLTSGSFGIIDIDANTGANFNAAVAATAPQLGNGYMAYGTGTSATFTGTSLQPDIDNVYRFVTNSYLVLDAAGTVGALNDVVAGTPCSVDVQSQLTGGNQYVRTADTNGFTGALTIGPNTVFSGYTRATGNPFGSDTGKVAINGGVLEVLPGAAGLTATKGETTVRGMAGIWVQNSALTLNSLVRPDRAILGIHGESSGWNTPSTTLGVSDKLFVATDPNNLLTVTNGMVAPWMVDYYGRTFLTYGANGFAPAAYTVTGGAASSATFASTATDIVNLPDGGTVSGSQNAYAVRTYSPTATVTDGALLSPTANDVLHIGSGGLILSTTGANNGAPVNHTANIDFGSAEGIVYIGINNGAMYRSNQLSGALTGSNGLTISSWDTNNHAAYLFIPNANNGLTGQITIDRANVWIGNNSSLGPVTNPIYLNCIPGGNGNYTMGGLGAMVGNITVANTITLGPLGGALSTTYGTSMTVSGQITGSGTLYIDGFHDASITLSNASTTTPNNYTGGTWICGTGLSVNTNVVLGSGPVVVGGYGDGGGRLYLNGNTNVNSNSRVVIQDENLDDTTGIYIQCPAPTFGSLEGNGRVFFNYNTSTSSTLTVGGNGATTDFTGIIADNCQRNDNHNFAGSLVKTGTGTLTLWGDVLLNGNVTVNNGTLAFNGTLTNSYGTTFGTATISGTGTLAGTGVINDPVVIAGGTLGGSATINNTVTLNSGAINAGGTVNGLLAVNAGTVAGTTAVNGNVTIAGAATVTGRHAISGNVALNNGSFTADVGTTIGGTLDVGGTSSYAGSSVIAGAVTNAGTFTGTHAINANYTQSAGSFSGTSTFGTALAPVAVTVNAGSFSGNNTINGTFTTSAGSNAVVATHNGSTAGTLAIVGTTTLDHSTVLNFNLGPAGTTGGNVNDFMNITGNLSLDGTLNVNNLAGFATGTYVLIDYTGALTGAGLTLGTMPTGFNYSLNTDTANEINLVVKPFLIPGDTNGDTAVNSLDIDAIYRHLTVLPPGFTGWEGVGGDQPWPWAQSAYQAQYDVNNDQAVSQDDVTYELRNYFLTSYGDADLSKATDFQDFQALLDHWQNSGAGIGWSEADFNGDGVVDFLDFQNLLDYWNPSGWNFAPTQTPEPASLSLILLGGLALLRRSRK